MASLEARGFQAQIKEKLESIEVLTHDNSYGQHRNQIRKLKSEINGLLHEDEVFWRQRSRAIWLKVGDHNTRFFHQCAIDEMLEAVDGIVTPEMNKRLIQTYSATEIKNTIFQMHPSKPPRPDGMTSLFFQKYLHIVRDEVVKAILLVLTSGHLLRKATSSMLYSYRRLRT